MSMKAYVLNCPVELINTEEALGRVSNALENKINYQIVTINPEMVMNAQKNEAFFNILNNSDLNIADGVGIKIALKFQKINLNHIRGVDFSRELIKLASKNNLRVAFLGAKEEVINLACENFLKEYPSLNIVYSRNGYFENDDEIIQEIKSANPQILLVGLGSPKQEELILKLKTQLNGCVMIGVGGSFDVFSGLVKESPKIWQKLGLEWLYRTLCQPERFKRIFPVLPIFLIKCIISSVLKKG